MDVRDEFNKHCGPSVLFIEAENTGRTLKVSYTIPGIDADQKRFVIAHLNNGLDATLHRCIKRCAKHASDDAYWRTGHRDADLKRLLSGRTV